MKHFFITLIPVLMVSCHTAHSLSSGEKDILEHCDSSEVHFLFNDSIDRVIKKASTINLYQMEGFFSDSVYIEKKDSLFNYVIKKNWGNLNEKEMNILYSAIGDETYYKYNYAPIRQPFRPNFTLEFNKDGEKAFIFVSLGTGEIAIVDQKGVFRFYLMKEANIIEHWYDYVLNERLQKNL